MFPQQHSDNKMNYNYSDSVIWKWIFFHFFSPVQTVCMGHIVGSQQGKFPALVES